MEVIGSHLYFRRNHGSRREEVIQSSVYLHTAIFKWITNKVLSYSTGKAAQCYMAAWMGAEYGG